MITNVPIIGQKESNVLESYGDIYAVLFEKANGTQSALAYNIIVIQRKDDGILFKSDEKTEPIVPLPLAKTIISVVKDYLFRKEVTVHYKKCEDLELCRYFYKEEEKYKACKDLEKVIVVFSSDRKGLKEIYAVNMEKPFELDFFIAQIEFLFQLRMIDVAVRMSFNEFVTYAKLTADLGSQIKTA